VGVRQAVLAVTVVVLVAAGASACGGGSAATYDAASTRACLSQSRAVREIRDQIFGVGPAASLPAGSSWQGYAGQTQLAMAVMKTARDARAQVDLGHLYAGEVGGGPDIYSKGNVVLAWAGEPTDGDRKSVESCLSTTES